LKHYILLLFSAIFLTATKAQKIDSIYVNLYTDSLKKGTFNYINIDGLSGEKYLPLDSTYIIFTTSGGSFSGNSLWLDPNFPKDKVTIKAILRSNPSVYKEFDIYIKTKNDNEKLKTADEIMREMGRSKKTSKKG
jgi:hypothetical protein